MRHWKICKTNRCPFYYRVYKTSSREFKRHGQSILPIVVVVVVVVGVVMSPLRRGGGHIVLVWIPSASASASA